VFDTRVLLNKITAFRERLEKMPRLVPETLPKTENAPATPVESDADLLARVQAGSRTQALLEQSIRQLANIPEPVSTLPVQLTARARRLLKEAHDLIADLRQLADDPLLAGAPPGESSEEIDPLALYYRETAALMEPAVRIAQNFPETPSVQLRLCDGLDGILNTVRQRLATLRQARDLRRQDAKLVEALAQILVQLDLGQKVSPETLGELAEQILIESTTTPLRYLHTSPVAAQTYLGGTQFTPPVRFVAAHSVTTARVIARIVRHAPEWRPHPHGPVIAALLHDVGMLRISPEALGSTVALNETQRRSIEAHARASSEIVANLLPEFAMLVDSIGTHHERLDGTGYPGGLKADQIPPLARLLGVVDTYAALCCPRPHRLAHDPRTALTDTLLAAEQNLLDRFAAEKLMTLGLHPVGSVVELGDGSVGVVAANHQGRNELFLASRPVLNLLVDKYGQVLATPQPVDLAEMEEGIVVRTLKAEERARLLGRHFPQWCI
jgi:hypothetical protein